MLWKIMLSVIGIWCFVYTASYGVFEYKRKNPPAWLGVFALCALILVATGGIVFFG